MLLNLDAGEHPDEPPLLWAQSDILCVACGGHAGDVASMEKLAAFCASGSPRLGAHPSYPDREGFGRRALAIGPEALAASLVDQCAALAAIAARHGIAVGWVKPHGALYHAAAADLGLARVVVDAASRALGSGVTIIGPPEGSLREAALASGLGYLREGFADRNVTADGKLVSRSEPDALITDPAACAQRARDLSSSVDTICVHADTPNAVAIASAVRAALSPRAHEA